MKKTLLLIFSICMVTFISCNRGTGSSAPAASAPAAASVTAAPETGNLGAFSVRMEDNFQWSDGYQGKVSAPNMLGGNALAVGDTYNLRIKFTTSRDMENELYIGFADTTEAANWWKWLSMEGDGSDDLYIPGSNVKAGEEVSATITLNIINEPTSASAGANTLVIETRGEGNPGTPYSGVQKPFDINFTEFVLTKVN